MVECDSHQVHEHMSNDRFKNVTDNLCPACTPLPLVVWQGFEELNATYDDPVAILLSLSLFLSQPRLHGRQLHGRECFALCFRSSPWTYMVRLSWWCSKHGPWNPRVLTLKPKNAHLFPVCREKNEQMNRNFSVLSSIL